jgi:two-component system, cell cycle response regulator
MDALKELICRNDIKLPSPPSIALRLLEVVKKDDFSFIEVAKIIQYDPALTAKVLKVVNSALYSLPDKIGSIERALAIMGVHAVKNIVFSFNLVDGLKLGSTDVFSIDYFWKRSIIAAIGTDLFAEYFNIKDDDIFVTALLQDLGILILHSNDLDEYSRLIEEKNRTRIPVEVLEKRRFGFSHQDLCSEVLQQWGLPENICLPIRHHHNYKDAPEEYRQTARILFLSNALSSIYSDIESYEKIKHFSDIIKRDLDISDSALESLVDRGGGRVIEVCSSFEMPSRDIKPLATLLQEANEGLSALNFSYERLLEEYKKEKMQAETLTLELKATNDKLNKANQKLKEAADHDFLTGLYNRKFLFDFLEKELHRAERYGENLSIMIFDIDYFKAVNDTYGHQNGDLVLKAMCDKAAEIKRTTDLLARYGGEEFVMVMPRTNLEGATVIAERLRKAIEGMDSPVDGHILKMTISIGVSACGPHVKSMTIDEFFELADQALYDAKKSGRNRVVTADRQASV